MICSGRLGSIVANLLHIRRRVFSAERVIDGAVVVSGNKTGRGFFLLPARVSASLRADDFSSAAIPQVVAPRALPRSRQVGENTHATLRAYKLIKLLFCAVSFSPSLHLFSFFFQARQLLASITFPDEDRSIARSAGANGNRYFIRRGTEKASRRLAVSSLTDELAPDNQHQRRRLEFKSSSSRFNVRHRFSFNFLSLSFFDHLHLTYSKLIRHKSRY